MKARERAVSLILAGLLFSVAAPATLPAQTGDGPSAGSALIFPYWDKTGGFTTFLRITNIAATLPDLGLVSVPSLSDLVRQIARVTNDGEGTDVSQADHKQNRDDEAYSFAQTKHPPNAEEPQRIIRSTCATDE